MLDLQISNYQDYAFLNNAMKAKNENNTRAAYVLRSQFLYSKEIIDAVLAGDVTKVVDKLGELANHAYLQGRFNALQECMSNNTSEVI